MQQNPYLTIIAIIIQVLLLCFFKQSKVLPIKKNRIFSRLLKLSLISSFFILIGIYVDLISGNTYANLAFLFVISYWSLLQYLCYVIFYYISYYWGVDRIIEKHRFLYQLPVYILPVLFIHSYWNRTFIYINSEGYLQFGTYKNILYFIPIIYLVLLYYFSKSTPHKKTCSVSGPLYACALIFVAGLALDIANDGVIVINICFSICAMILYITLENPDFYKSQIAHTYNTDAFMIFVDELLHENKPFYLIGCSFKNMSSLKRHHGEYNLRIALRQVGNWLQDAFPEGYIFYPDNDCFIALSQSPIDTEKFALNCNKRFAHPFGNNDINIYFHGNIFSFDNPCKFRNASDIVAALDLCIEHTERLDTKEIKHIGDDIYMHVKNEIQIEQILQTHIMNNNIDVYYQPLYSVATGRIEGAEALARLDDETYGLIPPGEFIPLAEKNGNIIKLGAIIFRNVCSFVHSHDLEKLGIHFINVNLSPVQFQDLELADTLKAIASEYDLDLSYFDFEITETSLTENTLIEKQIALLKDCGATVSLDDFGKGNSNMARLTQFPFTLAKLDMSLVWNYFEKKDSIMKHAIALFKEENLEIVAEGVETEKMATHLKKMQCDYLQGYYFSKPIPPEEFYSFVKNFNEI